MGKHRFNEEKAKQDKQATDAAIARGDDPKKLAEWTGGHVGRGVRADRGGENARDTER